ncbi:MAG: hypothetical protein K1X79_03550 [Oligoflexia bacterium]|nr:hypothetical protein [Oligoflexia bacterium]
MRKVSSQLIVGLFLLLALCSFPSAAKAQTYCKQIPLANTIGANPAALPQMGMAFPILEDPYGPYDWRAGLEINVPSEGIRLKTVNIVAFTDAPPHNGGAFTFRLRMYQGRAEKALLGSPAYDYVGLGFVRSTMLVNAAPYFGVFPIYLVELAIPTTTLPPGYWVAMLSGIGVLGTTGVPYIQESTINTAKGVTYYDGQIGVLSGNTALRPAMSFMGEYCRTPIDATTADVAATDVSTAETSYCPKGGC